MAGKDKVSPPIPFETLISVVFYADTQQEAHDLLREIGEGIFDLDFVEQVEIEKPRRLDCE
jgi:hypothetical protein